MANKAFTGSVYIDSTGALISSKSKVAYIIFTANASSDSLTLHDGSSGSDPIKLTIKGASANQSVQFDFSRKPMLFQNGIYCAAISAGAVATLVLTTSGDEG